MHTSAIIISAPHEGAANVISGVGSDYFLELRCIFLSVCVFGSRTSGLGLVFLARNYKEAGERIMVRPPACREIASS